MSSKRFISVNKDGIICPLIERKLWVQIILLIRERLDENIDHYLRVWLHFELSWSEHAKK